MANITWLPDLASGDQPAGGRVVNPRLGFLPDGRRGVQGDFQNLPKTLQSLIKTDRYPALSSEIAMIPMFGRGADMRPGPIVAVSLLGSAIPAVTNLQDLAGMEIAETIEGIWLAAEGEYTLADNGTGSPGPYRYTREDIERIAALSAQRERIPLKLGHGDSMISLAEARQMMSEDIDYMLIDAAKAAGIEASITTDSAKEAEEEKRMELEQTVQKLSADLAAAQAEAAKEKARADEAAKSADERVKAVETANAAIRLELAKQKHEAFVQRLSEPIDGRALPKSAVDLFAKLAGVETGVQQLAEGENRNGILEDAAKQLLKAGLVTVKPHTVGTADLSEGDDVMAAEYKQLCADGKLSEDECSLEMYRQIKADRRKAAGEE